jgi:cytochrome c-type biogenesis protein CcmH/NrfG
MNAVLFASAFAMTAVAFTFVVLPLRRRIANGPPKYVFPAVVSAMLLGIALYAAIGRPDAALTEVPARTVAQTTKDNGSGQKPASVDRLLAGLEERLRQQPDDGKGWLLLAKSYDHIGRKKDSLDAYAKAKELGVDDAEFAKRIGEHSQAISYPLDSGEVESVSSLVD